MRVALYARVSTRQHGQDVETQLGALRIFAKQKQWRITDIYADRGISGSKQNRPELDRLMLDASRRKFDGVLVARFDRFARSVKHLIQALETFQALGIHFISLSESIDTQTPIGKMIFTVLAAVAELERSLIRERVQMGVDRARREGKRLGRPRNAIVEDATILRQLQKKVSVSAIAREWGIARSTVRSIARKAKGTRRQPPAAPVRRRAARR